MGTTANRRIRRLRMRWIGSSTNLRIAWAYPTATTRIPPASNTLGR
jgi:hypothetical protein